MHAVVLAFYSGLSARRPFIPDLPQLLYLAISLAGLGAMWWLITRADSLIARLFPHWEWEKQLGWLNIRAARRAARILRWLGYLLQTVLVAMLGGILWAAPALRVENWDQPEKVANSFAKLTVLLFCLGSWIIYLGWELIPRMRREHERKSLEKFRAEMAEREESGPEADERRARFSAPDPHKWKRTLPPSRQPGKRY